MTITKVVDLTHWREMTQEAYDQAIEELRGGGEIVYHFGPEDTRTIRVKEFFEKQGGSSVLVVGEDHALYKLPKWTGKHPDGEHNMAFLSEGLMDGFVKARAASFRMGFEVVPLLGGSHPPDFLRLELVESDLEVADCFKFFLTGDTSDIVKKLKREPTFEEKQNIRKTLYKYFKTFARIETAADLHLNHALLTKDLKRTVLIDFLPVYSLVDFSKWHRAEDIPPISEWFEVTPEMRPWLLTKKFELIPNFNIVEKIVLKERRHLWCDNHLRK